MCPRERERERERERASERERERPVLASPSTDVSLYTRTHMIAPKRAALKCFFIRGIIELLVSLESERERARARAREREEEARRRKRHGSTETEEHAYEASVDAWSDRARPCC